MAAEQLTLKLAVDLKKLRKAERHRIEESFDVFDLSAEERKLILEALDSDKWDWFKDCDGCSFVSEAYWPTKYFPPCLRHDYDFLTSNNGMEANRRFYSLSVRYGVSRVRSGVRFAGVTLGWAFWFKWRNKIEGV